MHVGEHDVRAQPRARDERTERADEHRRGRIEPSGQTGDVAGDQLHHLRVRRLHDVSDDEKAAHRDEHGEHVFRRLHEHLDELAELDAQRGCAQQAADEDHTVDPEDIAERAEEITVDVSDDPDIELDRIESRLDLISKYKKKYGPDIEDVLNFRQSAQDELAEIEMSDDLLIQLRSDEKAAFAECIASAKTLTEIRRKTAAKLEASIVNELKDLDMPKVRFVVDLRPAEPGAYGCDDIEYLISANPGEEPKPLSNIASGGELSRIMLAIKTVFSDKESTGTRIYDEIDTGISGATSQKLGFKLKECSSGAQIICVTHSAQIAALADTHYLVGKTVIDGRTETSVTELDRNGRLEEISRIMGGVKITDKIRRGAEELLDYNNN